MKTELIKNQVRLLEKLLWNDAGHIGWQQTQDTVDRIIRLIRGRELVLWDSLKLSSDTHLTSEDCDFLIKTGPARNLTSEERKEAVKEYEAATLNEKFLTTCFHCASVLLDAKDTSASHLDLLCLTYMLLGGLQDETGASVEKALGKTFSMLGKAGAEARHKPMRRLREWAVSQFQAGNWRSANSAAHALKDQVIEHGRTIGAHISKENAQRTIAEWFRKSV